MNKPLPIFKDHNISGEPIGKIYQDDGYYFAEFFEPVKHDDLPLECGFVVIRSEFIDGEEYYRKIKIYEISVLTE